MRADATGDKPLTGCGAASLKLLLGTAGVVSSFFLPVPFSIRGATFSASAYLCGHAIVQHPDSPCMHHATRWMSSRTWQQIIGGGAVAALGGGLSGLAYSANSLAVQQLGTLCMGLTFVGSFVTAYTDRVCRGDYSRLPEEAGLLLDQRDPSSE